MKSNYLNRQQSPARVSRAAMANYLQRATIDKHIDKRIKENEAERWKELHAYASAVDANWLYTLHVEKHMGAKALRNLWEAMIRNRVAFRQFYRDGSGGYEEQPTGQNVEDEATLQQLKSIGVDLKAWEDELIIVDPESGEVSFGIQKGGE